jgi:hypothetical protein
MRATQFPRHRLARRLAALLILTGPLLGCATYRTDASQPTASTPEFVNRVWQVSEMAGISPGQWYIFLSDGSLVMTSPHSTPAMGRWSPQGDGLTMVEDGISYRVDIVKQTPSELHLRSHNPGGAVEIRLEPARTPATTAAGS